MTRAAMKRNQKQKKKERKTKRKQNQEHHSFIIQQNQMMERICRALHTAHVIQQPTKVVCYVLDTYLEAD